MLMNCYSYNIGTMNNEQYENVLSLLPLISISFREWKVTL